MNRMCGIAVVILVEVIGALAQAAPKVSQLTPVALLDSDEDKTVDISEIGKAASDAFDNIDTDGDGAIDMRTIGKRLSKTEFKKADSDKDGVLNKNEYFAVADSLLRAADQDKDGTLDEKEFNSKEGRILQRMIQ